MTIRRWLLVLMLMALGACRTTSSPEGAPTGKHAMVASGSPLATQAGVEILRRGGNAVDAAVATAFALAVVTPAMSDLGGGGYMVAVVGKTPVALDFRMSAPSSATRDMFLGADGNPTERARVGHLASGVPGTVAGLWEAHHRFGRRPWAEVVQPAIRLAEDGFVLDSQFVNFISVASPKIARFPASSSRLLPDGHALQVGTRFRNPDMARTLRRIAEHGADDFYHGETAQLIVAEMQRGGGLISREDLANYRAIWREPIRFEYRGHRVISMPPSAAGGITLALMANMLEGFNLHALGWGSPEALHLETEAMRRAYAVRNELLGDPDFVAVPQERLISKEFAASLRATIDRAHATPSSAIPGASGGGGMHTTHFSVGDADGNAVALTVSVGTPFGSGVTVSGAGFVLTNQMDDFAAKPGVPNQFHLVQGEANAIAPGKRPISSNTPAIVLDRDGHPMLITGGSGGPRITTAVFQIISNVLDFGMDAATAVRMPRIHHQHLPDTLMVERGQFAPATLSALRAMGHDVQEVDPVTFAPSVGWSHGVWQGGADPRTPGSAEGY